MDGSPQENHYQNNLNKSNNDIISSDKKGSLIKSLNPNKKQRINMDWIYSNHRKLKKEKLIKDLQEKAE